MKSFDENAARQPILSRRLAIQGMAAGASMALAPEALAQARETSPEDFTRLMKELSNWNRWGKDDEMGAVNLITPERITAAIRLADQSLRAAGIAQPRIGVAALNPHCGENGLFGDEEITVIRPTVEAVRASGVNCSGPISSDVIFLKALKNEFDGVVMMYHDQGQIATKLLGFNKGVTVTAGLKTVFTTPAHGTAYDIAGKGVADTGALEQALRIAARMAAARIH